MSMSIKKRLVLGSAALTTVAAAATLIAGVTFGLFSSNVTSSGETFATGTVAIGAPVTDTQCHITNMVPGDESVSYAPSLGANNQVTKDISCVFVVTYNGSAPAFIGLGTSLTGTLGGTLQWEINQSDGSPYTSAVAGVINTNTSSPVLDPLYVATNSGTSATYTFTVDYALPTGTTDQTLTAALLGLTVYAVQAGNNGTGVCTVGVECANITSWS